MPLLSSRTGLILKKEGPKDRGSSSFLLVRSAIYTQKSQKFKANPILITAQVPETQHAESIPLQILTIPIPLRGDDSYQRRK